MSNKPEFLAPFLFFSIAIIGIAGCAASVVAAGTLIDAGWWPLGMLAIFGVPASMAGVIYCHDRFVK